MTAMLRLPDELLLNITTRLCGASGELHRLSRVHRRFRFVVQESLLREGRIRTRDIPVYIQLLSEHPALIPQVVHIELFEGRRRRSRATLDHTAAQKACIGFLDALPLGMAAAQYRADLDRADWASSEFWVIALLAIMSHTKTLTIRSNDALIAIKNAALMERNGRGDTDLEKKLRRTFLERLEAFRLPAPDAHPSCPPNLVCFQALTALTIWGGMLTRPYLPSLRDFIPPRLEIMHIPCDRSTFPFDFLTNLKHATIYDGHHPHLQSVLILISEPCPSFIDSIKFSSTLSEVSRTLRDWKWGRVDLQILFKDINSGSPNLDMAHYKPASNLLQEIKAVEAEMFHLLFQSSLKRQESLQRTGRAHKDD